jgi:hypothetical protein
MTVLLIWLLVGCAGREGASGGQNQENVGESSIEQQKAQQEESSDSERTVSGQPRLVARWHQDRIRERVPIPRESRPLLGRLHSFLADLRDGVRRFRPNPRQKVPVWHA